MPGTSAQKNIVVWRFKKDANRMAEVLGYVAEVELDAEDADFSPPLLELSFFDSDLESAADFAPLSLLDSPFLPLRA
jgi:hypothetical protein